MARSSKLAIILGLNSKAFTSGLARASKKFKKFGSSMSSAGRGLTMGLTAPLGALAGIAGKTAIDFEFAMAKVAAVAGSATPEALAKLESEAKRLGATTAFSASEVAGLQLELSKLGVKPDDIVLMEGAILNLSQAFDEDLSASAETVGRTLSQFQLNADQATRVTDVMAVAFGSTALDLERFTASMEKVGPIANDAGLSLEETTSLLGIMASNGISGADAGTKLKIALTEIRVAGLPVKDTLKKISQGAFDFEGSLDLLGKRAQIIAPILGNAGDATGELFDKLSNSEGAGKKAADVLKNTTQGALLEMKSALEGLAIAFGELLLPKIQQMADLVSGLAAKFTSLSTEQKETVLQIAGIASAIGPVLFVLGKLSSLMGVISGIAGSISLPILAAAAAIGTAVYLIYTNWESIVLYFTEGPGTSFLDAVLDAFNQFVGFVVGLVTLVVDLVMAIWDTFGEDILKIGEFALGRLMETFGYVFSIVGKFLGSFVSLFQGDWEGFLYGILDTLTMIVGFIVDSFLFMFESVAYILDLILNAMGIETDISGFFSGIKDDAKAFFDSLIILQDDAADSGTDYFSMMGDGIDGLKSKFSGFTLGGGGGGGSTGEAPTIETGEGGGGGGIVIDDGEGEDLENRTSNLTDLMFKLGETSGEALAGIGDGFADAIMGVKSFGEAFKEFALGLIKQLISLTIGHLITTFLAPSPDNLATGGVSGLAKAAAAPGIVGGLFAGLTKMASGGAVLGPTLALIGENPASRGEFVVPFEKMGQFLNMAGGGGSDNMTVNGRLVGNDIFLSNERVNRTLARRRVI